MINYTRAICTAAAVFLAFALVAHAEEMTEESTARGRTLALELGIGTQGILSYEEAGVRFPMIGRSFFIAAKARMASCLTWATFIDLRTGESVSFHPDVVAGILSFGRVSPFVLGPARMYGGCDVLFGYSFTPWDSAIYGTGNLIGGNLTYAVLGYFGIELFTAASVSVYLDAGGGFKTIYGDEENPYVIASSWLGSGFGIRAGMRFYP